MKLTIATDIHGSAYYAQKVVDAFLASKSDKLVLLGDLYYHGPRNDLTYQYDPMKVSQILANVADRLLVVQGNCDSEVDMMISNFPFEKHRTLKWGDYTFFFTHGHVYNKSNLPPVDGKLAVFYGHFHESEIVEINDSLAINVGSASLPRDGKNAIAYVDEKAITICELTTNKVIVKHKL